METYLPLSARKYFFNFCLSISGWLGYNLGKILCKKILQWKFWAPNKKPHYSISTCTTFPTASKSVLCSEKNGLDMALSLLSFYKFSSGLLSLFRNSWCVVKFAKFYIYKNPKLPFPFFISCLDLFFPYECPGLCRHFCIYKIWQILKRFSRQLISPHITNFWRVISNTFLE